MLTLRRPETANPYRVGTRVICVYAEAFPELLGATGVIVDRYDIYRQVDSDGQLLSRWSYGVSFDRHGFWFASHREIRPLCPLDPIADAVGAEDLALVLESA